MAALASLLAQWLRPAVPRQVPARLPVPASASAQDCADPREDAWLPASSDAAVMAPQRAWLLRLRYAYGAEPGVFDRDIGAVVARYAQYVHLLPATQHGCFRHAGGLLRMGLEIGFYALQGTDGAIFSGLATVTRRAALEPRWRYATFLAGLCSELYRSLAHLTVSNERGEEWPACRRPLALWLQETDSRRYRVRWLPNPVDSRALTVVAMAHVVTPPILQYLAAGNAVVLPQLLAAASGAPATPEKNTLEQLVRRAAALVIDREEAAAVTELPRSAPAPSAASRGRAKQATEILPPPRAQPPRIAFSAAARLHPALREALREIIATVGAPTPPRAAMIMERGAFVPLHEFSRRGVDPAAAVRSLSEAQLLARDVSEPQSWTCTCAIDGELALGVVLAPHCVGGLEACAAEASGAHLRDRR